MVNQNSLEFNQAYYYVCGRNDAGTNVYLPAVVFAEQYVEQGKSGSYIRSIQGFYDEKVAEIRANEIAAWKLTLHR